MEPHAPSMREKVHEYLRIIPSTCDAVEVALEMRHQTAAARIRDLVKAGILRDSGRTAPTRSGRKAVIWEVRENA